MDATTATAKRKRPDTGTTAAAANTVAVDEASDAEVEEFYAILRRIRDASRRLCGAGARPAAPRAPAWRPSFSWEDFVVPAPPAPKTAAAPAPAASAQPRPDDEPVPAPASSGTERAAASSPPRAGLDLNAEPEPEAPPSAPATPRSARAPA